MSFGKMKQKAETPHFYRHPRSDVTPTSSSSWWNGASEMATYAGVARSRPASSSLTAMKTPSSCPLMGRFPNKPPPPRVFRWGQKKQARNSARLQDGRAAPSSPRHTEPREDVYMYANQYTT